MKVRTRFAPSPTGVLHIGGVRTALFNYLFAKQNKGDFVLRIEDTDPERSKKEFEKEILESLKWCGIEWNEGPDKKGKFSPYRQSERIGIYKKYLETLLKEKKAYYCFCSSEELEAKRQSQMVMGQAPIYDGKCFGLSPEDVEKQLKEGQKAVIRLRIPKKKITFKDIVRGEVEMDASLIGDFVIARSLDNPLFYLAGVIDDEEMQITHVIRGEEHISNTPKQILIQEAMGFKRPIYAHIPLILATDRSKLSKRHGAVAAIEYRNMGYLPEAIVNFLAFLGWNPGTEKEFFTLDQLVKEFNLENVQKGGAIFNQKRLDFLNGYYIRLKPLKELTELVEPFFKEAGLKVDKNNLEKIVYLYQARLKNLKEIVGLSDFFFKKDITYPKQLLKWQNMSDKELAESLDKLENIIIGITEKNWDLKNIQNVLMLEAEQMANRGYLLWPLRVALTGKEYSAGPFEIADILGREETLRRIKEAKKLL